MKKVFIAVLAMGMVGNAFASCPANLNGKWAGVLEEQEQGTATGSQTGSSYESSSFGIMNLNISGGSVSTTYLAAVESGAYGGQEVKTDEVNSMTLSYNRGGCNGTMTEGTKVWNFIVTDKGRVIHAVSFEKENESNGGTSYLVGEAKKLTLTKQ